MINIVKGSETYSKGFKMKAIDPRYVVFRFLPGITDIDKRREFHIDMFEQILNPVKERKQAVIVGGDEKKSELREALLIYQDGNLMWHMSPQQRLKEEMDLDIFSAMLTAVQNFIGGTFKEEKGFKTLQHGGLTLAVERGPQMFLVVVYTGKEPAKLRNRMRYSLIDIYDANKRQVKHWDGTMESLTDIEEILGRVFEVEEET